MPETVFFSGNRDPRIRVVRSNKHNRFVLHARARTYAPKTRGDGLTALAYGTPRRSRRRRRLINAVVTKPTRVVV